MTRKILCIGHSHMEAARHEYTFGRASGKYLELDPTFVQMHQLDLPGLPADLHTGIVSPVFLEKITVVINAMSAPPEAVFLWIGGSIHHDMALVNQHVKFDVILPDEPDIALSNDAQIVPFQLMKGTMKIHCGWKIGVLNGLRNLLTVPMYQFQSPPPNPSEELVRKFTSEYFQKQIEERGISPIALRYKLWRIHSDIYREACTAMGIEFVSVPKEAVMPDGSMAPTAWAERDGIHANLWYGSLLWKQINELVGV